jgi:hypothetical protein
MGKQGQRMVDKTIHRKLKIEHTYKTKDRVTRTPLKINVGISYLQEESDIWSEERII